MLESFLNDWGISTQAGVVIETDKKRVYDNYGYTYYLDYADEVYGEKYKNRTTKTITSFGKPLKALFSEVDTRSTSVLLTIPETAALQPLDLDEALQSSWKPENAEVKGPFDAGIIGTKRRYDNDNLALESHVAAFSSIALVYDTYLGASAYDNSNYILDVFSGLCDKEESISVFSFPFSSNISEILNGGRDLLPLYFLSPSFF